MNFIKTHQVSESLYILEENLNACVAMGLVIGSEKAAIIDTGYGFSKELKDVIRKITDKPVICLLTHCDPDHAGAAPLFDEIYMNPLDKHLMKTAMSNFAKTKVAENFFTDKDTLGFIKKNMVKEESFDYKPLADGDIINLGDIKLEAIALGGHSPGSMCFLNRKDNYAIAGDSIANIKSPVLMLSKCLPLAQYKKNLLRFINIAGKGVDIYQGHDVQPFNDQLINEILILIDEVLAGKTQEDTPYLSPVFKPGKDAGILKRLMIKVIYRLQMGDGVSMEHKKDGFTASIKYNAKKLR